ncbi:hypothetical protein JG687_00009495 [Phytophthora cactorum]|uniref:RxLR effector protein n=1 Tax=Phytophthora cactorum TaxID=29920 RepID=A0A8T1UEU9_9STRA|nr:hypothetical protein JG687_00009495 [Phytophthora cactorum]
MRVCYSLLPTALLLACSSALPPNRSQTLKTATSDVVSPVEPRIQHENTDVNNKEDTAGEDDEEERINAATMLGKGNAEWDDALMRLAYSHWFEGGKTIDDVRLIMSLPAKGEAVGHENWGKYLKYVEFVKEKKQEAANAAIVAVLKRRRAYRDWYIEGKTEAEVRKIFELPAIGTAQNHPNWEKFEEYLEVVKEYSKIVFK